MMSRIAPLAALLVAVGLFFGYVHPTFTGSVKDAQAQIKSYEGALRAARDFSAKETELIEKRNAIPPEGLSRLETFLPDGVDNVQLILDLDALANRTGVKLSDFDTEKLPEDSGRGDGQSLPLEPGLPIESITISVNASGTYDSFRAFLAGVEASLRPLDLVSLTLQSSETGVYVYQMTFSIYWLL